MKTLKTCGWSLATWSTCGAYVFLYLRRHLDEPHTLTLAVVAGTFALAWFLCSIVTGAVHLC